MKTTSLGLAVWEEHNNRSGPKMEKGVRYIDVSVPAPLPTLPCKFELLFTITFASSSSS